MGFVTSSQQGPHCAYYGGLKPCAMQWKPAFSCNVIKVPIVLEGAEAKNT